MTDRKSICTFLLVISYFSSAQAGLITFLNQDDWLVALPTPLINVDDFTGDAIGFDANSSANSIGNTAVKLRGGVGDPGPTGLTGSGFFQAEVDSSGTDALALLFSFDNTYGFALSGLQNDSSSNPSALALDEIGLSVGPEQFVLSELTGTVSSDVPFLGFVSDELISSFSLFHAGEIRSITRTSEEFYLDSLSFATESTPVSEPPMVLLFMAGLLGVGLARKTTKSDRF